MRMKQKMNGKMRIDKGVQIFFYILLIILSLSLLVPVIWMLMNSFKGNIEYYQKPTFSLPESLDFDNYSFFLNNIKYEVKRPEGTYVYTLPWMFLYSIVWAVVPSAFSILVTTMCAYVIARYKFPGRNFLYSLGIVVMVLPIVGSSGSAMLVRRQLGIFDNMPLMILTGPSVAFSGMNFLIMYAAFKGVPWEYAEAVFIDGGGHLRVFLSIMLPMVLPSAGVLVLLGIIGGWNDYETFLLWLPSYANVARGIYNFQYLGRLDLGATMPQILAGFVVVSLPMIILYICFQKVITANFMVGGLKG